MYGTGGPSSGPRLEAEVEEPWTPLPRGGADPGRTGEERGVSPWTRSGLTEEGGREGK